MDPLELDRGHGIPYQNASPPGSTEGARLAAKREPTKACANSWRRNSNGCARARRPPRQKQGARRALRGLSLARIPGRNETNEIYIPPGERWAIWSSGEASASRGDRLLIDNLNFRLPAGGIVGIIGPNSAGKTTLFRMMSGLEKPDSGELRMGPRSNSPTSIQSRQSLDDKKTVWEEISGLDMIKVGNYETPSRGYVGASISGRGPATRSSASCRAVNAIAYLAKVLKSGGNVLMLDEPTNDLDVETLRALEEALLAYPGCAVVISHDRWFLIASPPTSSRSKATPRWYGSRATSRTTWKISSGARAKRPQPHRIKYKYADQIGARTK